MPFQSTPPGPGPGASRETLPGVSRVLKRGGKNRSARLSASPLLGVGTDTRGRALSAPGPPSLTCLSVHSGRLHPTAHQHLPPDRPHLAAEMVSPGWARKPRPRWGEGERRAEKHRGRDPFPPSPPPSSLTTRGLGSSRGRTGQCTPSQSRPTELQPQGNGKAKEANIH